MSPGKISKNVNGVYVFRLRPVDPKLSSAVSNVELDISIESDFC